MKCSFQSHNQVTDRAFEILPKLQLIFCSSFLHLALLHWQKGRQKWKVINSIKKSFNSPVSILDTSPPHSTNSTYCMSLVLDVVWPSPGRCYKGLLITMETEAEFGMLVTLRKNKKRHCHSWKFWASDRNCRKRTLFLVN